MIPPPGGRVGRYHVRLRCAADTGRRKGRNMVANHVSANYQAPAFRLRAGHRQVVG